MRWLKTRRTFTLLLCFTALLSVNLLATTGNDSLRDSVALSTEEVSFPSGDKGITIAGSLSKPIGKALGPAVILIPGGGPQDRDGGPKPYQTSTKQMAEHLTRSGLVVLRCDRRGVGKSTGDLKQATTQDFADDVLAGLTFLKRRQDLDTHQIGLVGHCEGALVASMAASKSKDVRFVVLMACPAQVGSTFYRGVWNRYFRQAGLDEGEVRARQDIMGSSTNRMGRDAAPRVV
jgi:uncharacterized protein